MLELISDTNLSFWVSASAGCGKTTLLIKRLLFLLIDGQKGIFCITFTNAAAKEMQNRLFKELAKLSLMQKDQLIDYIKNNLLYKKDFDYLYVQSLFYTADSLVKISTFHSFCSAIIKNIDLFYHGISVYQESDKPLFDSLIDQSLRTKFSLPTKISEIITESRLNDVFSKLLERPIDISKNTKNSTSALLDFFADIKDKYQSINDSVYTYDSIIEEFIAKKPWQLFDVASEIDHILVDEAQDTNVKQWYIVAKLCEDFFLQEGKTLFVVGDKKQSIYGFQGASPQIFTAFYHILKSQDPGNKLIEISIEKSYRSAKVILDFVDKLFYDIDLGPVFKSPVKHLAHKKDSPGYLAIYPLVNNQDKEDEKQDKNLLLARSVAKKIKDWVFNCRILPAKKRCIKPSDIAVLVAHRTSFITHLNQELQTSGIPVNLIGKIKIEDNPVLSLLLNIGKFILHPYDELALLEILRSAIFCMQDQDIFAIKSSDINKNLWELIKDKKPGIKLLNWINFCGDTFDIFTNALTKDVQSALLDFYGPEFEYYLDIFLTDTLKVSSMYTFLDLISKKDATLSAESANTEGVTISTVHGSKGLEYPIVFIADANYKPVLRDVVLYDKKDLPIWTQDKDAESTIKELKKNKKEIIEKEHLRLLYVALTRAEDEVHIIDAGSKVKDKSWYDMCLKKLQKIGKEQGELFFYTEQADYLKNDTLSLNGKSNRSNQANQKDLLKDLNLSDEIQKSSVSFETKRGDIIHKALEYLFDVQEPKKWLKNFLDNFALEFSKEERLEMQKVLLNFVSKTKDQQDLKELEIIFKGNLFRIDKVKIEEDCITITDYKTGKVVDKQRVQVQMEKYKKALKAIYPTKKIECKIARVY